MQICFARGDEAEWSRFRGPDGRGIAGDEKRLPVTFGTAQNLRWKTAVSRGLSSPCVFQDRIFLTGFDDQRDELQTMCLDRLTGDIKWQRRLSVEKLEKVHDVGSPAAPTPATDGERVYVYFGSYGLLCYDLDGGDVWKHPLPIPDAWFGTGASPIVAADVLIQNVDQTEGSYLLAVNRRTGIEVWKQPRPGFGRGWATPIFTLRQGVGEVLVLGSRRLIAYAAVDGTERWSVADLPPFTISSPSLSGNSIVLAATDEFGEPENVIQPPSFDSFVQQYDKNGDGKISFQEVPPDYAVVDRRASKGAGDTKLQSGYFNSLDVDKDKLLDRNEWDQFVKNVSRWTADFQASLVAVQLKESDQGVTTSIAWRSAEGVPEVASLLVYKDRVYTVKNGGIVFCRDAASGRLLYKGRLGAGGGYYASPIAGDDKIYFASDRGTVVVLKAGDRLQVLAQNDLQAPIMATPAIVDGNLYVRTDGHLFAFAE